MIPLANVYHKLKLFRFLRDIKVEVKKFLYLSNMSSTTLALLVVGAMVSKCLKTVTRYSF